MSTMPQSGTLPDNRLGDEQHSILPGMLDGLTIMRYAHVYRERTSGGVEQYLRQLDQHLLQRHRLTVLQMHLTSDDTDNRIDPENVGIGRVLWVPVPVRHASARLWDLPERIGYIYHRMIRLYKQKGEDEYRARVSSIRGLLHHHAGHLRYKATILSEGLERLLKSYHVDLLALHWLSYDTDALIVRAQRCRVPFVVINHFGNRRLSQTTLRNCIARAARIGVVSDVGLPDGLRDCVDNLSDAVNTDFFSPEEAGLRGPTADPIVLLPARIETGKGHHDLIEAARRLISGGVKFDLWFVGATDSSPLEQDLRSAATAAGLTVRFLGEKTPEELRDLYARSSIIVLPSYSEGLGRVLLEAQAMARAVVSYDSGGTRRAFLPDETGLLVRAGDIQGLAAKIGYLLKNEAERLRMGRRGREFVSQRFSISALVNRHERFYLEALGRAASRSAALGSGADAQRILSPNQAGGSSSGGRATDVIHPLVGRSNDGLSHRLAIDALSETSK